MEVLAFLDIAAFVLTLSLSIYLFLRKPENNARELFSVFLFLTAISALMAFYSNYATTAARILLLRAHLATFLFSVFVLLHFTFALADKKFNLLYYLLPAAAFLTTLFTNLIVKQAATLSGAYTGQLVPLAVAYVLLSFLLGIWLLGGVYLKLRSKELKRKVAWILAGLFVLLGEIVVRSILKLVGTPISNPFHHSLLIVSLLIAYPFIRGGSGGAG